MKADPAKLRIWQPIISQYKPTFLTQCENAVTWAKAFVRKELAACMFAKLPPSTARANAKRIVNRLSDFTGNRSHSRHIHVDECRQMGLTIEMIEGDGTDPAKELQDLILTVHHCYMHSLVNTPSYKMIENHNGEAWVKQAQQVQIAKPG
jgi:hypothetical protein